MQSKIFSGLLVVCLASLADSLALTGTAGKIFYGFSGNQYTNADYMSKLGRIPAVKNEFFTVGAGGFNVPTSVETWVTQTTTELPGAMLMITLEPNQGLTVMTTTSYNNIAAKCVAWSQRGIKMYIRYAHEMNADWYPWGVQPTAYKASFRALALAIKNAHTAAGVTNYIRMVWAPTVAYSPDLVVPYLDFYPGNDVVDWVGLSLYHFATIDPKAGLMAKKLTTGGGQDFYETFCVNRTKPMMIAETAAPTDTDLDVQLELNHKAAWWTQLYSLETATTFPMLRLVVWFEFTKYNLTYNIFEEPAIYNNFTDFIGTTVPIASTAIKHLTFAGDY